MERLIEEFRRQFDTVIIDTPPMLHLSDARILGRLSDGMILVLRAGRVRRESAIAAEQRMRDDGIPVLGTVLNDWDPKKDGYGVYSRDRRDYSYFTS
jgi:Mrp family chromosome partitioning ATPase